jgi:glycosyltransferase involved in cell wall biosynthesis
LFPKAHNVHLIKDVGMIGYKLSELYNVNATLATYNNDEYSYLKDEVKGLNIDYIDKRLNFEILDSVYYITRNAKRIDVLQLFHMTLSSVIYTLVYKLFNRKGKVFLKLDCTWELVNRIRGLSKLSKRLFGLFLDKVDIIGAEQKKILDNLKNLLGQNSQKLEYVPNGVNYSKLKNYEHINKENIILNVARIGNFEKATEVLLEAFSNIGDISDRNWKLVLVGPIEEGFQNYIDDFFLKHDNLKDIIEFKGAIYDRQQLYSEYGKAKIFCLSSIYESFGISLIEAAAFGDVIVSTDVGIASELVEEGCGAVVKVGDVKALSKTLEEYMDKESLTEVSEKMKKMCYENYDWDVIIQRLYERILKV